MKKRKRTLEEIITKITPLEKLNFNPLPVEKRAPQLNLPSGLDMTSPYSLFSLFFPEEVFEKIANSTNIYAHLKRENDKQETEPETENEQEIKKDRL